LPRDPPAVLTWADAAYLAVFMDDIRALRARVDVVVASVHWGLGTDVLTYMEEIAPGGLRLVVML
jgi:poly-gamma-glutamate capsule biosynthesis protein CapA/YwtB (metallophosphatase superfamily)